ncbi:hypothetical protein [Catenuloplanes japonicus]|uniref:hypothetical protein n=1 Tax=Catenuloplanes japonicus TaxID=33876 RepID=UPI000526FE90|nr:hypothetical protein [Catenuloplanes japonicus]
MVRMPWSTPSPDEVDRLFTVAENLAVQQGITPASRDAAVRALMAARKLATRDPSRENRGRLLRASGRSTVNVALDAGDSTLVQDLADQTVTLARELLHEQTDDDTVREEAVLRLAQAGQILASAGRVDEGRALVSEAFEAAGPGRGRTAATGALLTVRLDDLTERAQAGENVAAPPDLGALAVAYVDGQRALAVTAGNDPAITFDLAEALGTFARAAVFLRRPDLIGVAMAEQMSILMMFDGGGARAQLEVVAQQLRELRTIAPEVTVVIPGPDAWRHRGSYGAYLTPSSPVRPGGARKDSAERRASVTPPWGAATHGYAERLERGIALSRGGRLAEAYQLLSTLAGELATGDGNDALRARTLWRQSMVEAALGRIPDAWETAQTSVTVATRHLDALPDGTEARRTALADTAVYLTDASQIAAAAGHPDAQITLLDDAIARCGDVPDRAVRRALGTALHNLANAMTPDMAAHAERAVTLRRSLVDESEPLTVWEYANTLVLAAGIASADGRPGAGVTHLVTAAPLLVRLGPAAAQMVALARKHAAVLARLDPAAVRSARSRGQWPYA